MNKTPGTKVYIKTEHSYCMTPLAGILVSKAAEVTAGTIHLDKGAEVSSYFIARLLIDFVNDILRLVGMEGNKTFFIWLYVAVVFAFAFAVGTVVQLVVVFILRKITPHLKSPVYSGLLEKRFFIKTCRIIPPLIFLILIRFTLYAHMTIAEWLTKLSWIYILVIISMSVCTLCDVIWQTLDSRENHKRLPLKGIVQVIKLLVWCVATIIIAAIILDKSPGALLAGLGAFAAVLMLIFKDSILGIVAGVQLAENDSLHVGDWIAVPGSEANGVVSEVSLTEVKVINWDKTVSTVPPYNLISGGFRNFRNMQESGTRRIQRSIMIDADSVVETTSDMLKAFMGIPMMNDWISKKIEQRDAGKVEDVNNSAGLVDGTIDTNLGVFRAYLQMYLESNPEISHKDTCFVTTLAQTPTGIPLQVYCFTNTSSWIPYEGIQALVFEHIAAMLHRFNLYTFENPTGRDTLIDGYLSPGKNPKTIFGMPYPFFNNSGTPDNPGVPPAGLYQ